MTGHPKPPPRETPRGKPPQRKPIPRGKPIARGTKKLRKSPYQHPEVQKLFRQLAKRSGGWCEGCDRAPATQKHHDRYNAGSGWRRLVVPLEWLRHLCFTCHADIHPHLRPFEEDRHGP